MNNPPLPSITLPAGATFMTYVIYRTRGAEGLLRAWLHCRTLLGLDARTNADNLARFANYPGLPPISALVWYLYLTQAYFGVRPIDLTDAESLSAIQALRTWETAQG
jgi:hypothetical protein